MGPAEQHGLGRSGGLGLRLGQFLCAIQLGQCQQGVAKLELASSEAKEPTCTCHCTRRRCVSPCRKDTAVTWALSLSLALSERLSQRERERENTFLAGAIGLAVMLGVVEVLRGHLN